VATSLGQCEIWRVYLLFSIYMFCILFVCVLVFDDNGIGDGTLFVYTYQVGDVKNNLYLLVVWWS
jgi:hypothetical protein